MLELKYYIWNYCGFFRRLRVSKEREISIFHGGQIMDYCQDYCPSFIEKKTVDFFKYRSRQKHNQLFLKKFTHWYTIISSFIYVFTLKGCIDSCMSWTLVFFFVYPYILSKSHIRPFWCWERRMVQFELAEERFDSVSMNLRISRFRPFAYNKIF